MSRRTVRYGRISRVVLAALILTGCGTVKAVWAPLAPTSEAERTVRHAEGLDRAGQPGAAADLYQQVVRQHPADQASAEALYRLGVLQADPRSPQRDYRAARVMFCGLLTDYPNSRWDTEARAWQAMLTDLLLREDEARRAHQRQRRTEEESKRTKTNLDRLKQTDLDLERRR
jgi:TolA-binding protein